MASEQPKDNNMKQNDTKTDGLDIEASRLVSGGFEVMHQTGEYDWEQSCGPYKTAGEAEAARLRWFRKDEIPYMRVVQFFHTNKPISKTAQHEET